MKIRTGFVSNSSSSSFICEICDNVQSGWDFGLEEAEMCECENGHIMCEEHVCWYEILKTIVSKEDKYLFKVENWKDNTDVLDELLTKYNFDFDDYRNDFPKEACPICNLEEFTSSSIINYLLRKNKTNLDEIGNEIRSKFKNLKELEKYEMEK